MEIGGAKLVFLYNSWLYNQLAAQKSKAQPIE
jgi:hypothetical protein